MKIDEKEVSHVSIGSVSVIVLCVLIADSARGVLFPTLFLNVSSMGGNSLHLGWAVAALSMGKILSTPLLGFLSDKYGYQKVLIFSNAIMCSGCVFYILAQSVEWLVFAQLVIGLGAGSIGVNRSFVAEHTIRATRSQLMAYLTSVQHAGATMTPIVGAVLTLAPARSGSGVLDVLLSRYHLPAFVLFLAAIGCIILLLVVFEDISTRDVREQVDENVDAGPNGVAYSPLHTDRTDRSIEMIDFAEHDGELLRPRGADEGGALLPVSDTNHTEEGATHETHTVHDTHAFSWPGFVVGGLMNVAIKGAVSVYETLVMPYAIEHYDWSAYHAGTTVAVAASVGFVAIVSLPTVMRVCPDVTLVQLGLCAIIASCLCLVKFKHNTSSVSEPSFYAALGLLYSFGYPVGHTAMLGVVSKLTHSGPQGKIMGYFASAGSLARVLFPILAGALYYWYEANVVFVMLSLVLASALLLFSVCKKEINRAVLAD